MCKQNLSWIVLEPSRSDSIDAMHLLYLIRNYKLVKSLLTLFAGCIASIFIEHDFLHCSHTSIYLFAGVSCVRYFRFAILLRSLFDVIAFSPKCSWWTYDTRWGGSVYRDRHFIQKGHFIDGIQAKQDKKNEINIGRWIKQGSMPPINWGGLCLEDIRDRCHKFL